MTCIHVCGQCPVWYLDSRDMTQLINWEGEGSKDLKGVTDFFTSLPLTIHYS